MGSSSKLFDELAAPALLSYLMHWMLQGVLTVQVYFYYLQFPQDPLRLKILVYGLFVFEWVEWGLVTEDAFITFVFNASNGIAEYSTIANEWFSLPIMCALVSVTVQCFFAWRIYKLSSSRVLGGGIVLICLTQSIGGIMTGVKLKESRSIGDVLGSTSGRITIGIWVGGTVIVDVVIAVSMTILMLKMKTGIINTNQMIDKLVRLTVETGTLTASVAVVGVALALAYPEQSYYMPAIYNEAKLYANSLVAHLLNRAYLSHAPAATTGSRVWTSVAFAPRMTAPDSENSSSDNKPSDREVQVVDRTVSA
ncbi:uncharacterized protein B0H18DRAFT_1106566 [Fomitopsis serialis]|uniref:uncharacterized protein n=1 Tax=Fomitopsis serialis TaxID=139415 RepID=UPI0020089085|nr:uncharacterized protein B0H18DRAFT_1106566 [Neoantrodia serialis]KAH9919609.1 hypothetical protein B0H18DRAFT_1106566 [Neoantrodia serialis]